VVELHLPEHLDSGEFDRLNEAMLKVFAEQPDAAWVLDLSRLSYMGSSVLGLMVNVRQRVKEADGRLALCGMSPRLHQIFRTCCLERLFVIKPDRAGAVRAVAR
jgi:anti-anti-sigma factor